MSDLPSTEYLKAGLPVICSDPVRAEDTTT